MVTSSREWCVAVQDTACSEADLQCSNQDLCQSHLTPPAQSPLVCTVAPRSVCYLQSEQRCNSLRVSLVPWRGLSFGVH